MEISSSEHWTRSFIISNSSSKFIHLQRIAAIRVLLSSSLTWISASSTYCHKYVQKDYYPIPIHSYHCIKYSKATTHTFHSPNCRTTIVAGLLNRVTTCQACPPVPSMLVNNRKGATVLFLSLPGYIELFQWCHASARGMVTIEG